MWKLPRVPHSLELPRWPGWNHNPKVMKQGNGIPVSEHLKSNKNTSIKIHIKVFESGITVFFITHSTVYGIHKVGKSKLSSTFQCCEVCTAEGLWLTNKNNASQVLKEPSIMAMRRPLVRARFAFKLKACPGLHCHWFNNTGNWILTLFKDIVSWSSLVKE